MFPQFHEPYVPRALARPSRRTVGACFGLTAFVLASAFVAVFPDSVPFDGVLLVVPGALTVVVAVAAVASARNAARPLYVFAVVPLFALSAFNVLTVCLGVACSPPPGYEPWRNVKFFVDWWLTGPTLGVSSEPYQCAVACPHRIELVPLALGYVAAWKGFDGDVRNGEAESP